MVAINVHSPSAGSASWAATAPAGPAVPRMVLGMRLRRLREARSISQEEAGQAIRASHSKICRLELGRTGFKPRDVTDLLTLYGVIDEAERATLMQLAEQANTPGWWQPYGDMLPDGMHTYLGMEQSASVIRSYDVQVVPPLLQTAAYARAVISLTHRRASRQEIERRVELCLGRQGVLHRPEPVQLWAVIDEAALRRPIGGVTVMREQLRRLIEVCALPHVTVQILPFGGGGHAGLGGPLTLMRLPCEQLPDMVYLEQLAAVALLDRKPDSDRYWDIINQLAVDAELPENTPETLRSALDAL